MRLLKITVPAGMGGQVKATAFSEGLDAVSIHQVTKFTPEGSKSEMDVVDIDLSTPHAKRFLDALFNEDYFESGKVSIEVREARSLIKDSDLAAITVPLVQPAADICEELWQFSHITYGLVGRVLISAGLLAYGIIESRTLIIISGLLFLPVLPMIMAISFGVLGKQPALALQGLKVLLTTLGLIFVGGLAIAAVTNGPVQFNDLGSPLANLVITIAVGVAATLATIDDTGRRELIGLAAASQIGIVPAWIAASLVHGTPAGSGSADMLMKIVFLAGNIIALTVTIAIVQYVVGAVGSIRRIR
jgi:hypothetical protein